MPIRFRCAYCNQLMAISRRKAGTVVRCPKCAGEIIVPSPEGTQAGEENPQQEGDLAFEDPNFDAYLEEPDQANTPAKSSTRTTSEPFTETASSATPGNSIKRRGLFLPLGMVFVAIGAILLLLALMFVIGWLVGRSGGNA